MDTLNNLVLSKRYKLLHLKDCKDLTSNFVLLKDVNNIPNLHSCVELSDVKPYFDIIIEKGLIYFDLSPAQLSEKKEEVEEIYPQLLDSELYKDILEKMDAYYHTSYYDNKFGASSFYAEIDKQIPSCGYNEVYEAYIYEYGLDKWMLKVESYISDSKFSVVLYHYNKIKIKKGFDYHIQFTKILNAHELCAYIKNHQKNKVRLKTINVNKPK